MFFCSESAKQTGKHHLFDDFSGLAKMQKYDVLQEQQEQEQEQQEQEQQEQEQEQEEQQEQEQEQEQEREQQQQQQQQRQQQQQQQEEEEEEEEEEQEQEQERIWAIRELRSCTKFEFWRGYTYICSLQLRRSPACRAESFHSLPCVF